MAIYTDIARDTKLRRVCVWSVLGLHYRMFCAFCFCPTDCRHIVLITQTQRIGQRGVPRPRVRESANVRTEFVLWTHVRSQTTFEVHKLGKRDGVLIDLYDLTT